MALRSVRSSAADSVRWRRKVSRGCAVLYQTGLSLVMCACLSRGYSDASPNSQHSRGVFRATLDQESRPGLTSFLDPQKPAPLDILQLPLPLRLSRFPLPLPSSVFAPTFGFRLSPIRHISPRSNETLHGQTSPGCRGASNAGSRMVEEAGRVSHCVSLRLVLRGRHLRGRPWAGLQRDMCSVCFTRRDLDEGPGLLASWMPTVTAGSPRP